MNNYAVRNPVTGSIIHMDAESEFHAISKVHEVVTGEHVPRDKITWHGLHAECGGYRYNRPILLRQGAESEAE